MSQNPVAIVTGASRGIGRAAALYFANVGYDVALVARSESDLIKVQDEIHQVINPKRQQEDKAPVESGVFIVDVTDQQQVEDAVSKIHTAHQRIDVLFNNAGIFEPGTSDIAADTLHHMIQVNCLGVYYFTHAVVPHMKQQQSGYIFNLASYSGIRGLAHMGGYSMTKFGVVGFSDSLYKECLPYGIKVTAICPSVIETPMTASSDMPDEEKIRVDDIVSTVDYLISLSPTATVKKILVECAYIERQ